LDAQIDQFYLPADIEVLGWLIEQQQAGRSVRAELRMEDFSSWIDQHHMNGVSGVN
jgi:hypothetical protein